MNATRSHPRLPVVLTFITSAFLTGCGNGELSQSALDHAGDQSSRITGLWWFYLAVLTGIWTLVVAVMMIAVAMHRRGQHANNAEVPVEQPEPRRERRLANTIIGATLVSVVILFVLLFADILTERVVSSAAPPDAMMISVTGHQWWWELNYQDKDPSKVVRTANELHIPAGKPVKFLLNSTDVIHSFWVPNLHGKKDLIPGHPTSTWFVAKRPGTYYGQCGEFCGHQHAHMRIAITVDPPEQFAAWLEAQRKSAPDPANASQHRGQQVFLGTTCIMCHTVQGTPARGLVGPDLTHLASRQWLGAGALPNVRGYLGGWILDPQTHKPGVHMPQHAFSGEDLNALLDYLETLK